MLKKHNTKFVASRSNCVAVRYVMSRKRLSTSIFIHEMVISQHVTHVPSQNTFIISCICDGYEPRISDRFTASNSLRMRLHPLFKNLIAFSETQG